MFVATIRFRINGFILSHTNTFATFAGVRRTAHIIATNTGATIIDAETTDNRQIDINSLHQE